MHAVDGSATTKGRPGYKFNSPSAVHRPPRGGLCFMLANEGEPYAHWTPRGGGHAESMGHCWFDSVQQELLRERPEHPASTSFMAARQWFAAQLRAACHATVHLRVHLIGLLLPHTPNKH